MTERDLLADCLARLNRIYIPYFLTGSMASNYWGVPRTTHDIDFAIHPTLESVPKIVEAFTPDYHIDAAAVVAAFKPPYQFNALDTRSALKVDFWLPKGAAFEEEMFNRRLKVNLFGQTAWIATAEDVVLHKLVWNQITPSDRQLGDAAGVIAVQRLSLDEAYLKEWAESLGLAEVLKQLLSGNIRVKET